MRLCCSSRAIDSSFSSASFCAEVATSDSRFSAIRLKERWRSPTWSRRRTGMRTEKSARRTAAVARESRFTARDRPTIITTAMMAATA